MPNERIQKGVQTACRQTVHPKNSMPYEKKNYLRNTKRMEENLGGIQKRMLKLEKQML